MSEKRTRVVRDPELVFLDKALPVFKGVGRFNYWARLRILYYLLDRSNWLDLEGGIGKQFRRFLNEWDHHHDHDGTGV